MTKTFEGSSAYWEARYADGGDSGKGSYGELAEFKAKILNKLVSDHDIRSVIEFGCGDGNQLTLARYPSYRGYDVSSTALDMCRKMFVHDESKKFFHVSEYAGDKAQLTLSLDVLFHLVENEVFDQYMRRLFAASSGYVAIYCSDEDRPVNARSPHVRHRKFSDWIARNAPEFRLADKVENPFRRALKTREGHGSPSDFYFYQRR